jgi:beta-phosphoglucomutase-like phosphatase (HAD superfamily)
MVLAGARALGVDVRELAVVGDIGSDVEAAHAAGARSVLVPTAATRRQEIADAPLVAADLSAAVDLLIPPVIMGSRHRVAGSHDHGGAGSGT